MTMHGTMNIKFILTVFRYGERGHTTTPTYIFRNPPAR